jgi:hypothetical protein
VRTLQIRFVKKHNRYNIQRKGWFGKWEYLGYSIDMGYGAYYEYYNGETKESLLEEVLNRHYQVCKKHVEIIEHPTIKIY